MKSRVYYRLMVEARHYVDLPQDWFCILTDVKNSTRANEDGRYKEVNMIGVSTLAAVENAVSALAFPFVFGGDGATLALPPLACAAALRSLSHTRQVARQIFGLELRIAVIPVEAHVSRGEILYGYHCYIQGPHKHIHFVDAAGGGYAMAAKQLKAARLGKV